MAKYKRNGPLILSLLHENEARQVIAKAPLRVQVPVRYSEIGLGEIGVDIYTYGMMAIISDDNQYGVLNVNAMVELKPYKFNIVSIDDVDYHEFFFDKGDIVFKTTELVQKEVMLFNVFDELIFKGKVPWYTDPEDLAKLFDTADYHAGSRVSENQETIEFVASLVTRSKEDRTRYARELAKTYADFDLSKIDYVPLKSVFYSVKSTVNKVTGAYFTDGVTSALVSPTDQVGSVERILRS